MDMNYEIVDCVEKLQEAIDRTREAQKKFATYTQEQVDKIFLAAASAANKARIPLAKMAVEETGMGIVEDRLLKITMLPNTSTMHIKMQRPAVLLKKIRHSELKRLQSQLVLLRQLFQQPTQHQLQFLNAYLHLRHVMQLSFHHTQEQRIAQLPLQS